MDYLHTILYHTFSYLSSKEIIDIREKEIDILDPIYTLWLKEDYFSRSL